jgi:hypothetical protein
MCRCSSGSTTSDRLWSDSNLKRSPKIVDKAVDKLDAKVDRDEGYAREESEVSETPNPFTQKGFRECTHQDSNLEPTDQESDHDDLVRGKWGTSRHVRVTFSIRHAARLQ